MDDDEDVPLVAPLVVLDDGLDGPLVVELEVLDDVDVVLGGGSPPSLQPATSAPPSTTAVTNPARRERTSLPFAVHGTAAAEATDRRDSTDSRRFGHPVVHRPRLVAGHAPCRRPAAGSTHHDFLVNDRIG